MKTAEVFAATLWVAVLCGCASEKQKRAQFFEPQQKASPSAKSKKDAKPPPFSRLEAETAIGEAVVLRFSRDASSQLKTAVGTVFVAFGTANEDPNAEFLRKFESQKLRALPISAAARSAHNTWIDKQTGTRGVALRIERIDLVDYYNARVPCSWSADPSGELPLIYQVSWKRGKWVVL